MRKITIVLILILCGCSQQGETLTQESFPMVEEVLSTGMDDTNAVCTVYATSTESFDRYDPSNDAYNNKNEELYHLLNGFRFEWMDSFVNESMYHFNIAFSDQVKKEFYVEMKNDDYRLYYIENEKTFVATSDFYEGHMMLTNLMIERGVYINEYKLVGSSGGYSMYKATLTGLSPNLRNDVEAVSLGIVDIPAPIETCWETTDENGEIETECDVYYPYPVYETLFYDKDYSDIMYYFVIDDEIVRFSSGVNRIPVDNLRYLITRVVYDFDLFRIYLE